NGTFLAVTGHPQLKISVLQTPVSAFVPLGENVTLQCTVRPENRAAELQVLWFRSAAGRSFPEIIYTHHNSSRQCEISSSKDGCVFNFTKNINNSEDTGTYYCAVSSCGKIIIGNGTHVNFKKPVDPIVFYLGAALGICVVVIFGLAVLICRVRPQQDSVDEDMTCQTAVERIYAAKKLRMKKRQSGDSVHSEVSYFTVTDANLTR
ncbi:immunoglobulin lambda-1 light chain-like, partial [Salminus brasiliensis]|uniref:immunoglobulin lambda-1 light chain-like n=1 Tax=Salminus brasiliensis TaxID=930266 RepID=UPI003B83478F